MNLLLSLATLPVFVASNDGGFEPPTLDHEFNPAPFLFVGTPFEINRILMVRLIAVALLALLLILYSRRAKLVPGRAQGAMESLLDFSRVQIGHEILGEADAKRFQPLLATLFLGILFMNLTGVIPGLQIAGTSLVGMPLIFALVAYIGFIVAGVRVQGAKFFKNQLIPPGVPKPLYVLMVPLEFLSTFILRPVTLTVRLLANMIAGHFILVLCFLGTHYLYFTLSGSMGIGLGTLTLLGGVIFVVFELFVGALQAYIFAMLAAVYISLSISEH
ncbi:F-type H+-transporting ATPase subunit a [Arcanobacterium pluranimalium]|uniref:F0F1 ATP synthase subunit A n=1 Tax=Arcanobacterium pluranimalium TaxID=108028 RepID=UPI001957F0E3|nr:F-type H+-transporting ATPase subunit a [Arcanobacterium pluranimalium]